MNLSEIFGKPNEGIHSHRVFGLASVDLMLTIIGGFVLSVFFKKDFFVIFSCLFILGQILHIGFGVETAFLKSLKKPKVQDIIFSGLVGWFIGLFIGINSVITLIGGILFSLIFNIFVFKKIKRKITEIIMSV
jgi:hypothetical protein